MDWEEIPPDGAAKDHGVRCYHNKNKGTDELRFRLLSDRDETAYIRTVSGPLGAWQESHKHSKVRETYIVQSGWIGYAEPGQAGPKYFVYREGQIFTVPPETIHNVYMPKGAVIHTIKHGDAPGEQRLINDQTKEFDKVTASVSEEDLLRTGTDLVSETERRRTDSSPSGNDVRSPSGELNYSDAYKHFDNLIWQVPAWTTAIAAIVFAGLTQVGENNVLLGLTGLDATRIVAVGCGLFGLFVLGLGYALFRFRRHQVQAKTWAPQPLLTPQLFLQLLVNVQAAVLLLLSVLAFGITPAAGVSALTLLVVAAAVYQEWAIRHSTSFRPS